MKAKTIFPSLANKRITLQYAFVLIAVVLIFLSSFVLTDWISKNAVQSDSLEYAARSYAQTQERIESYCMDLENVSRSLINNPTLIQYMKAASVTERHDMLKDINRIFANTRQLKGEIALVSLYDADGELIGSSGTVFVNAGDQHTRDEVLYSGPYSVLNHQEAFFSMALPVYDLEVGKRYEYLGTCFMLIDTGVLREFLSSALPTEESYGALLDANGATVLRAGVAAPEPVDSENWIDYALPLEASGWLLQGAVSRASLFGGITLLQRINFITYAMVFGLLALMVLILYVGIIKPVRHLVGFMRRHSEYPRERLEIRTRNEISVIGENLNRMLDDIDQLSEQNYRTQKRVFESELQRKQTEMLAYRNQINPHFLYNTFECIRGMALSRGADEIVGISEALSRLFRYSVKGDGTASLEDELKHVLEYARIIEYRFGGKHRIFVEADASLHPEIVPKMIIQPLVENAVFHGLENKRGRGEIHVDVEPLENHRMRIRVSDNGEGMPPDRLASIREAFSLYDDLEELPGNTLGVGLMNIYRRIRLFYADQAKVTIDSEVSVGTAIEIELPTGNPSGTAK